MDNSNMVNIRYGFLLMDNSNMGAYLGSFMRYKAFESE